MTDADRDVLRGPAVRCAEPGCCNVAVVTIAERAVCEAHQPPAIASDRHGRVLADPHRPYAPEEDN